jgi:hypothetical protein
LSAVACAAAGCAHCRRPGPLVRLHVPGGVRLICHACIGLRADVAARIDTLRAIDLTPEIERGILQ